MWDRVKGSKGFYIALSIIFAIVCWFYVDVTVEPDIYVKVRNIPVTYEGLTELENKGLMIEEGQNATVTLKLSGQRSVISQLSRSNITVSVDAAAQITGPGEQSLEYAVSFPNTVVGSSVKIKSRSVTTIDVSVVQASTKSVSVKGEFTGSVSEGYMEGGFELEHRLINVSGDKSVVDRIDHAVVTMDKTELTSDWQGTLPVTLVDKEGREVKDERLDLSHDEISVTLVVRRIKKLPLTVTIQDGGGATADDVNYTIDPETIMVSGSEKALDALDEWNLGTVDLAKVITTEKIAFELDLPEGVSCESGEKTVSVSVKLPKLTTIKRKTSNFELLNVPKTKTATLQNHSLEVRIRGAEKVLDLLVSSDISVQVDLSELDDNSYGTYTVPAKVVLRGFTEIGAVGTYEVPVYVS
jgi:YbbR domain-containing protein